MMRSVARASWSHSRVLSSSLSWSTGLWNPSSRTVHTVDDQALKQWVQDIHQNHGRALARAITLEESTRFEDRRTAARLMKMLLQERKEHGTPDRPSLRIGISGPPGVGKSSLIEKLGLQLLERGHRVGVLAVDPSSNRSGGSILGDKTRMPVGTEAVATKNAYIRPSPSRGYLGGVARGTHGSVNLLEAAGYDRILVETVGVGQSEVHVESMVDLYLLLLPPGGGDELQGIKKGVVELADILAVTKADGELLNSAKHARAEYANALTLLRPKTDFWVPKVVKCSSVAQGGLDKLIDTLNEFEKAAMSSGGLRRKREGQAVQWMWKMIEEELVDRVKKDPKVQAQLPQLIESLRKGEMLAENATELVLRSFLGEDSFSPLGK